eukprot:16441521-Heterocapsa_arctica.AAC.1
MSIDMVALNLSRAVEAISLHQGLGGMGEPRHRDRRRPSLQGDRRHVLPGARRQSARGEALRERRGPPREARPYARGKAFRERRGLPREAGPSA